MDMLAATQPWSGNYSLRTGLWGYAHYGQFTKVGWQYLNNACGNFPGGGTHVALKSPNDSDFSIIIETKKREQPARPPRSQSAGPSDETKRCASGAPTPPPNL